jgi:hypothetical protein
MSVGESIHREELAQRVMNFTWRDYEADHKIHSLSADLIGLYTSVTPTPHIYPKLLDQDIHFYRNRKEFQAHIACLNRDYNVTEEWGYQDHVTGKMLWELTKLREVNPNGHAGLVLADALWHEFGHRDLEVNMPTLPDLSVMRNAHTDCNVIFRGGKIVGPDFVSFLRFDEVWNLVGVFGRLGECFPDVKVYPNPDLAKNGTDVLFAIANKAQIPWKMIHKMHQQSNPIGLASQIGAHLTGTEDSSRKGWTLFEAIDQSDALGISEAGFFGQALPQAA